LRVLETSDPKGAPLALVDTCHKVRK
jgi:hypothetical protein